MGRRRRFVQLDDDDDEEEEVPVTFKPSGSSASSSGPSSWNGKPKPQTQPPQQTRRRVAADDVEDEEEEDLELEEEEEEDDDEEEERREQEAETQTLHRRGRPKRRREPESEDEEPEEEDPREEGNTEAVPVGNPVRVTGKGKKQKKHYNSFEYEGTTFELEDPVLFVPDDHSQKPYVGIIKDITETEGSLNVTSQWFYRPEEADKKGGGSWVACDHRELFYSFHTDDVPAGSVLHKCVVHFIPQHKQIPSRKQHPGFIVQKVYDTVEKKLWNLTDKDYEDNKQQEIDLLVKKTIDSIGQLPDLEPEETPVDDSDQLSNKQGLRKSPVNPIDVTREPPVGNSEQFTKADTPGSDKPRNYAILVKYGALNGEHYRDKWLDKLVECIPLALKESARASHADPDAATEVSTNGSSAKDANSFENEKYPPEVVVPIMVALESSAYEALGNDYAKYNQKLRQLLFNIKNSSNLRRRLMDKELDPPVVLTMSPDELKVGLTLAERTSEPEESRQLQMTDTRCRICNEKKVGISDIIHAGHRDRYQLECTSCGHTWFSSRDSITTLTVDVIPSTAANVGTAPWATAKFDVLEKQLTSPPDQRDKRVANGPPEEHCSLHANTGETEVVLSKQEEPFSAPPNHE